MGKEKKVKMARNILLIAAFLTLFMFIGIECGNNRKHITVTHRNPCPNRECYESGHGSNSDGYGAVCCSSGSACYRFISTGQMGCFTMTDKIQNYGCIYECENPDDCKNRDHTNWIVPSLAYAKNYNAGGDICICTGDYCNSIWYTGWEKFGIAIGAIAAAAISFVVCVCACPVCRKCCGK